jgi:N,N-dimethylformamidase
VKRIFGYTDKLTVRPGEEIAFKVSVPSGMQYQAQLVRLVNGDCHSKAANFRELEIQSPINGCYLGREQAVMPGSFAVIEDIGPLLALHSFTLALHFMPTTPYLRRQHLLSVWEDQGNGGWSLQLTPEGCLAFLIRDPHGAECVVRLESHWDVSRWYQVAVRLSGARASVTLDCLPMASLPFRMSEPGLRECADLTCVPNRSEVPLVIAGRYAGRTANGRCIAIETFNGRIESPVIYAGVLTDLELGRVIAGERPEGLKSQLIADWDFSRDIAGTKVTDCSAHGLHGCTHNLPLRGVRGCRWSGSEMSWRHAPAEYGAIHFHTDDLYDCGWQTDIAYRVDDSLPSGIYAVRLRLSDIAAGSVEEGHEEYLPFFVAPRKGRSRGSLAFLVPTHTYLAYGNVRAWDQGRKDSGRSKEDHYATNWTGPGNGDYSVTLSEHPDLGSSTYDRHIDGSPVHSSSWLRPLLNLRPKSVLWTFCADLLIIDWLETKGFAYDIITDDLMEREGVALLSGYQAIMTGNHPEYQTTRQLDAFQAYLSEGGRLMYMGGNGFYWRCAAHQCVPGVIEVRRGRTGTATWTSDVGEGYLSFTGEFGGIYRDIGRPPQRLVGVGFIAEGHDKSHYRIAPEARRSRAGFLLQGVETDIVGDFGAFGTAVGQEIDKSSAAHGTPPHALVVARSEGHSADMIYVIEEMNPVNPVLSDYHSQTCAEVVFFETPRGGAVFSVGSMAWCGSLSHNGYQNSVSRITENALKRFLDPEQFQMPGAELIANYGERACL